MPVATLSRASRTATAADAAAVLACQRAALSALAAGSYADTRLGEWAEGLTVDDHLPAIHRGSVELVENDLSNGILAFAELDPTDGHIPSLFVHPGYFLQGLGSCLLGHLARKAGHIGLPRLTVYASLPAAGFYAKFGFTAEPERLMHLPGDIALPYIPMTRNITAGGELVRYL